METGYIFFNKTLLKYCVQELSKEPDDKVYLHTIKPYETMHVEIDGHKETITGINARNKSTEQWSYLEGMRVQYLKV